MRLAPEDIVIEHGGNAVRLRPSLRAAYRLDHRHGSFGRLVEGIQQMNITIIADIFNECGGTDATARRLLMSKVDADGVASLQHLVLPLFDLLAACYGVEPDEEHAAEHRERVTGGPFSMRKALEEAFTIATGWLGWTPSEALNATPSQIAAAYRGHTGRLRALYGGADNQSEQLDYDPRNIPSETEVAEGVARLKAMTNAGKRT